MNFVYKTGFSGRNLFGLGKYGPSSHGFVPEQQRFVAAICPTCLHPANLSELIPKNYGGHEKDYQNTRLNISIVSIYMQKGCMNIEI